MNTEKKGLIWQSFLPKSLSKTQVFQLPSKVQRVKQVRKKTKLFNYENVKKLMLHNEHRFPTNYFFIIVDQAIQSSEKRFKQLETNSEFLHLIGKLNII